MTFKAFGGNQTDDTTLPWTEEYVSTNPDAIGTIHDVKTLRTTDKGLMISTSVSKAFIYKSHGAYDHVIEFVNAWSGTKTSSPLLQVELTATRPFINIGVDDVRKGIWGEKRDSSWRQAYATVNDNPHHTTNPLPLPSSPGVVCQSEDTAHTSRDAAAMVMQTSQDLPLEESARGVNGSKGRNTRKGG